MTLQCSGTKVSWTLPSPLPSFFFLKYTLHNAFNLLSHRAWKQPWSQHVPSDVLCWKRNSATPPPTVWRRGVEVREGHGACWFASSRHHLKSEQLFFQPCTAAGWPIFSHFLTIKKSHTETEDRMPPTGSYFVGHQIERWRRTLTRPGKYSARLRRWSVHDLEAGRTVMDVIQEMSSQQHWTREQEPHCLYHWTRFNGWLQLFWWSHSV